MVRTCDTVKEANGAHERSIVLLLCETSLCQLSRKCSDCAVSYFLSAIYKVNNIYYNFYHHFVGTCTTIHGSLPIYCPGLNIWCDETSLRGDDDNTNDFHLAPVCSFDHFLIRYFRLRDIHLSLITSAYKLRIKAIIFIV